MKTRQELITATLELLNAIAAGQDPAPEDVTKIDAQIDGKVQELSRRKVIYFTDTHSFQDEFVDPLAVVLADQASPAFGQARDINRVAAAEATMMAMRPSTYVFGSTQQTEYF